MELNTLYASNEAELLIGTKVVGGNVVPNTVLSIQKLLEVRDKRLVETIDTVLCYAGRGFTRFGTGISMTSSTGCGVCKYDNMNLSDQISLNPALSQNPG